MIAIVCVNNSWGIGKDNKLLYHIKEDMNIFKDITMGKTLIYGNNTLKSFPNKAPLVGRLNIVVTHNPMNVPDDSRYRCTSYGFMKHLKKFSDILTTGLKFRDKNDERTPKKNTTLLCVTSTEDAVRVARTFTIDDDNIVVCGGASIYNQLLDLCDTVYVTKVYDDSEADTYFHNLDEDNKWSLYKSDEKRISESGLPYNLCIYKKV